MSQSKVIPTYTKPTWKCQIGNTVYEYQAGSTQTVPDEVAAIIDLVNSLNPSPAPEPGTAGQVWTRQAAGGGAWEDPEVELPEVTADDNGKVLKVVEGAWAAAQLEIPEIPVAENQAESVAEDVAGLVADFNELIGKLVSAGLMEEPAAAE